MMSKFRIMTARKNLIVGLVAVVTLVAGSSMAVAETISVDLNPVGDATMYSNYPDANTNTNQLIWASCQRSTLMQFNLPGNLAGETVIKADLEMQMDRSTAGSEISARRMTQA